MSHNLTPNVINLIFQSCQEPEFLAWLWHDKTIVNSKEWFKYKGNLPPWEWTSKVLPVSEVDEKTGKIVTIMRTFWSKPPMYFHGEHSSLLPAFVNANNYNEFINNISFIWYTHMRNKIVEIYWVNDIIRWGLRVRKELKKSVKYSDINGNVWMALEHCDKEMSIFLCHYQYSSLWQTSKDIKNHTVSVPYGLGHYMNSEKFSRAAFCDRIIRDRNVKGFLLLLI